jgi:hypothetical protein
VPAKRGKVDLAGAALSLKKAGAVDYNRFMLTFNDERVSFKLFPDGRAIISVKNGMPLDDKIARSIYSEYIGF